MKVDNKQFDGIVVEHFGFKAWVVFDEEINMFRGEVQDLKGHVDFYTPDFEQVKTEMGKSLGVYREVQKELKR